MFEFFLANCYFHKSNLWVLTCIWLELDLKLEGYTEETSRYQETNNYPAVPWKDPVFLYLSCKHKPPPASDSSNKTPHCPSEDQHLWMNPTHQSGWIVDSRRTRPWGGPLQNKASPTTPVTSDLPHWPLDRRAVRQTNTPPLFCSRSLNPSDADLWRSSKVI